MKENTNQKKIYCQRSFKNNVHSTSCKRPTRLIRHIPDVHFIISGDFLLGMGGGGNQTGTFPPWDSREGVCYRNLNKDQHLKMKSTLICMHIGRRSRLAYPKRTSSSDILLDFFLLRTKMSPPQKKYLRKILLFQMFAKISERLFLSVFEKYENFRVGMSVGDFTLWKFCIFAIFSFVPIFHCFSYREANRVV